MNDQDKFGVALTNCFYCGEGNEIILNRRLSKSMAKRVEALNGMVVSMTPCNKCEELMKQGVILLTIDPHKSDPDWHMPPKDLEEGQSWMPNPYRTGGFFVVRDDFVRRLVDEPELADWAIKQRWMFIEHEVGVVSGLFEAAEKEGGEDAPKDSV